MLQNPTLLLFVHYYLHCCGCVFHFLPASRPFESLMMRQNLNTMFPCLPQNCPFPPQVGATQHNLVAWIAPQCTWRRYMVCNESINREMTNRGIKGAFIISAVGVKQHSWTVNEHPPLPCAPTVHQYGSHKRQHTHTVAITSSKFLGGKAIWIWTVWQNGKKTRLCWEIWNIKIYPMNGEPDITNSFHSIL